MPYFMTRYDSPVGLLSLVSDGQGLAGLWIEGQKYFAATLSRPPEMREDAPGLPEARAWLDRYFAGKKPEISELPLAPMGSAFQRGVWELLCEIPYGQVTTYGEIAKKMAARMGKSSMSGQAVGGAVGHNPISIIIPCHRVVGANGSLTGYAGGIEKKVNCWSTKAWICRNFLFPKRERHYNLQQTSIE